jgi:hypothetical protein
MAIRSRLRIKDWNRGAEAMVQVVPYYFLEIVCHGVPQQATGVYHGAAKSEVSEFRVPEKRKIRGSQ